MQRPGVQLAARPLRPVRDVRKDVPVFLIGSILAWFGALGTPVSIGVAVLLAGGTYWRRPKLSLHALREHWRVERNAANEPVPFIRLLAKNGRLHRASQGTRVLVEWYQPIGGSRVHLGSPPLGWTSAADETDVSVIIFPGGERAVDLGLFQLAIDPRDAEGNSHTEWALLIAPYLQIFEGRNRLRANPSGYIIRIVIGSNDGRARRYDAHVNWNPLHKLENNRRNVDDLLESVQVALVAA